MIAQTMENAGHERGIIDVAPLAPQLLHGSEDDPTAFGVRPPSIADEASIILCDHLAESGHDRAVDVARLGECLFKVSFPFSFLPRSGGLVGDVWVHVADAHWPALGMRLFCHADDDRTQV
ncbi:hypothetical protein [Methylosinus sporium]|uniref:hypothetical protein n=1 Tax=Methylosinus sporium TaxID=428 RepID=UPI00383BC473